MFIWSVFLLKHSRRNHSSLLFLFFLIRIMSPCGNVIVIIAMWWGEYLKWILLFSIKEDLIRFWLDLLGGFIKWCHGLGDEIGLDSAIIWGSWWCPFIPRWSSGSPRDFSICLCFELKKVFYDSISFEISPIARSIHFLCFTTNWKLSCFVLNLSKSKKFRYIMSISDCISYKKAFLITTLYPVPRNLR